MGHSRSLKALLETIDADTYRAALAAIDPADLGRLDTITTGATLARVRRDGNDQHADDACQVARLWAPVVAYTESLPIPDAGRITASRTASTVRQQEKDRAAREACADITEEDWHALGMANPEARIGLPATVRPDWQTITGRADLAAAAWQAFTADDPAAADLLALATYLPTEDARYWHHDMPSASALATLLGIKPTGRNRTALAARTRAAYALLADHWRAARSRHHAAASDPTGRRTRPSPAAPTHPYRPCETTAALAAAAVAFPAAATRIPGRKGRDVPRTIPASGPASLPVIHDEAGAWVEVPAAATDALPTTRVGITEQDVPAVLATIAAPAHRPTENDRGADGAALADAGRGAVRQSSGRKRRRDGALGSPTTSGRAGWNASSPHRHEGRPDPERWTRQTTGTDPLARPMSTAPTGPEPMALEAFAAMADRLAHAKQREQEATARLAAVRLAEALKREQEAQPIYGPLTLAQARAAWRPAVRIPAAPVAPGLKKRD